MVVVVVLVLIVLVLFLMLLLLLLLLFLLWLFFLLLFSSFLHMCRHAMKQELFGCEDFYYCAFSHFTGLSQCRRFWAALLA